MLKLYARVCWVAVVLVSGVAIWRVCTCRSCALLVVCVDLALFVKVLWAHVWWPLVDCLTGVWSATSSKGGSKVEDLGFEIAWKEG